MDNEKSLDSCPFEHEFAKSVGEISSKYDERWLEAQLAGQETKHKIERLMDADKIMHEKIDKLVDEVSGTNELFNQHLESDKIVTREVIAHMARTNAILDNMPTRQEMTDNTVDIAKVSTRLNIGWAIMSFVFITLSGLMIWYVQEEITSKNTTNNKVVKVFKQEDEHEDTKLGYIDNDD